MGADWIVVVSDHGYADLGIEAEVLDALGRGVRLVPAQCHSAAELAVVAAEADAVLNQYLPVDAAAINACRRCRVISRYGVGFDTVDVAAATSAGVCVTNVPDYCVGEVSDHALALLLAAARQVVALHTHVVAGRWEARSGQAIRRLDGQVLGLVGFGRMARALAAKAAPLGLRRLAHDPYVADDAMRSAGVEPVGLEALLSAADFVSLHIPLEAGTRGLIDARRLGWMKPTAWLINTARGPIVDGAALLTALASGRLGGAALDVWEEEPLPTDHPLRRMPRVILTPHIAWYSVESEHELRRKAAGNVVAVLRNERPSHLVNPEVWERRRRG